MNDLELSVIAPCLNEELNVGELARRVVATFERGRIRGELILVDDGSTDGTRRVIERLTADHPGVVVGCFHEKNRGIARAWRTGALAARGALVAVIDSDLQYQPEDLLRLRRELFEHSVDVVQGWRSSTGRERGARYNLSRGFNTLLNATFGMHLRDNKSGFVMCAREVMLDLLSYRGRYFYWQSFIMVAAHAKGYSYKEVETLFEQRRAGTSFLDRIAYRASARSIVDLGVAAWEYRLRPDAEKAGRHHELLGRTQWSAPHELAAMEDEKLRGLIRHAYRNVAFYRERMRACGVRPEDVRTRADLARLPILERDDIRGHLYFDLLSENHDRDDVFRQVAIGPTDEPLVTFADRAQLDLRQAASIRGREWAGCGVGDPWVELAVPGRAIRGMRATSKHRRLVSVAGLSERRAEVLRDELLRGARLIRGSAEALDAIASSVAPLRAGDRRAVQAHGQTLTPELRGRIAAAFAAEVFDAYETIEVGPIAFECDAHDGLHVVAEGLVVEVLREDGTPADPGELGDVVVTDLSNRCLPFIRYRLGDRARAVDPGERCACGRGLPRLRGLQGREAVVLRGAEGQLVPAGVVRALFAEHEHAVRGFHVKVDAPGRVRVEIVRAGRWSEETRRAITSFFAERLGAVELDLGVIG